MRLYGDEAIKWCERTGRTEPSKWACRDGSTRKYHPCSVSEAKEWLEIVRRGVSEDYFASIDNDPTRAVMVDIPNHDAWPTLSPALQSHPLTLLDIHARTCRTVAEQVTGDDRDRHLAVAQACEAAAGWLRDDGEKRDAWGLTSAERIAVLEEERNIAERDMDVAEAQIREAARLVDCVGSADIVEPIRRVVEERDVAGARVTHLEHRLDDALTERDLAESVLVKIAAALNLEKGGGWESVAMAVAKLVDERNRIAEQNEGISNSMSWIRHRALVEGRDGTIWAGRRAKLEHRAKTNTWVALVQYPDLEDRFEWCGPYTAEHIAEAWRPVAESAPDADLSATKAIILHELRSSGDLGLWIDEIKQRVNEPITALVELVAEGRVLRTERGTYALTHAERDVQRLAADASRFMKERDDAERKLRISTPIG